MGEHTRCVTGICDIDMRYPELYENHSNVDGDIIMHKLPKGIAGRDARINVILKGRKE